MSDNKYLDLNSFLQTPVSQIRAVVPKSIVFAPGGTRRQAALHNIESWSDEYVQWAVEQSFKSFQLLFTYGVHHIFCPLIISKHLHEVNKHRHRFFDLASRFVAGPDAISNYQKLGCRVRLMGVESISELKDAVQKLQNVSDERQNPALWWTVSSSPDAFWVHLLDTMRASAVKSRCDLVMRYYGEEIPPVSLYLAFGKPYISSELIPPLLMGDVQCYWSQRAGYSLDEEQFRLILYDYAYLRSTWQEDKLDRAYEALKQRTVWERGPIIGLGERLGPFWYPAATPSWRELMDEESS